MTNTQTVMNDKYLAISYECLSSIGNSFELESMMSEVVITFYQTTKAFFTGFYESRDLDSAMIYAGKEIEHKIDFSKNECSLFRDEDFYIVVLPLRGSYMKFVYKDANEIEEIFAMVCNFQRKINFALSACAGVKELEELNDELEERVLEGVNKIREHEKMLLVQSKSAIMGEMLEMIAHQWRQPLTAIGMISNNMVFKIILAEDEDEDEEIDYKAFESELEDINKQVKYLSDTIDDFRNFFKESKSRQEVYIDEVITKSVHLLKKQFEQSSIEIEIKNECEKTILYTYKNELTQVLLNILHNSKDAFEAQDIKRKKIVVQCHKENDNIIINIQDNAGGIPNELLLKIFEPYFSTKKQKNGTGLGLYMSKIIANKHLEGAIFAQNVENGASFTIKMPIKLKNRGI